MTVMATPRFISIGSVQVVALVAYAFAAFITPVVFVVAMDPSRPQGGLAAGLSKMARGTVGVQVMAVRTV
jgi:hypothetical protein